METDNKSKISIVLPVYNGERFLGQAIESILAQVYTNWELIIVNDCSTDSSESIMVNYAQRDDRIKIINNPHNLKLPRSLNAGFKVATGDYFTWTSDDNLLKEDMLKRLCVELDASKEYGLVYSNHDDIDEEGFHICDSILGEPRDMGITGNVCGASFLYRRSVAELVGEYDPDLFLAEDYDYWMRLYGKAKILHIPDILYSCRRHKASLTSTRQKEIAYQTLRAIHKNYWTLLEKCETRNDRELLYRMVINYSSEDDQRLFLSMIDEMKSWKKSYLFKSAILSSKHFIGKLLRIC